MVVRGSGFHSRRTPGGAGGGGSTTVLLMHFNGTDGSTTFTDSGPNSVVFSIDQGTPTISVTQSKFGGASYKGNILASNPGPTGIIGTNAAFNVWQSDFTFEVFIFFLNNFAASALAAFGGSIPGAGAAFSNPEVSFLCDSSGNISAFFKGTSGTNYAGTSGGAVTASTWTHVAWVRHTNVLTTYIGGVAAGSTYTIPTSGDALTVTGLTNAAIGGSRTPDSGVRLTQGYMDELRMSASAIYTANFTPPSAPFTS